MPTVKVVRRFEGKEFVLNAVTSTKRSADFSARLHRDKGYKARVTKYGKYWGVWVWKK